MYTCGEKFSIWNIDFVVFIWWLYCVPTQYSSHSAEDSFKRVKQMKNKSGIKHRFVWMWYVGPFNRLLRRADVALVLFPVETGTTSRDSTVVKLGKLSLFLHNICYWHASLKTVCLHLPVYCESLDMAISELKLPKCIEQFIIKIATIIIFLLRHLLFNLHFQMFRRRFMNYNLFVRSKIPESKRANF